MSLSCPYCAASITQDSSSCPQCGSALEIYLSRGDVLDGRFEVLSTLGYGPLGNTYHVLDRVHRAEVVLKLIAPDLCPSPEDTAVLAGELEKFSGRTIAGCAMPIEIGIDSEWLFLISPWVDGATLRDVLDARAAQGEMLSAEESLRVLLSVASATQALHSATPHGALRPENVMITRRGVILTDGAIAGAMQPDKLQPRLRAYARAVPFVAPEVAAGKKVTATADLFAIGAIGAELLTGTPSAMAIDGSSLTPEIGNALRLLLDRDRAKRPGGLGALLNELSRACGLDRRPMEAPLAVPESPKPGSAASDEGATQVAMVHAGGPKQTVSQPAMRAVVAPPMGAPPMGAPPLMSSPPMPSHNATQPVLPAARMGIGRPMGAGGPPTASPGFPGAPPMPGPPVAMAPPPAMAPAPMPGSAPVAKRPSIPPPSAVGRPAPPPTSAAPRMSAPPMPSLPKVPLPGAEGGRVASPSIPASSTGLPKTPRVPSTPAAMPSPAVTPARPVTRPPTPSNPPGPAMPKLKRDLGDIDPRLVRAAEENERRSREFTDVDTGEIELLDD